MAKAKTKPAPATAPKMTAEDERLLASAIVTANGGAYTYATKAQMKTLLEWPGGSLVEIGPANPQDGTQNAWRATPAGAAMNAPAQAAQGFGGDQQTIGAGDVGNLADVVSEYVIESDIPLPAAKRGGRTGAPKKVYPFATMAKGASFFIPMVPDGPNQNLKPAKRIASVVSNFAKENPPMQFKVRAVVEPGKATETNPTGAGARVWRIEDYSAEELAAAAAARATAQAAT